MADKADSSKKNELEKRKAVADKNVGIAEDASEVDTSNADTFAPSESDKKADTPAYDHDRFPGEMPRTIAEDK